MVAGRTSSSAADDERGGMLGKRQTGSVMGSNLGPSGQGRQRRSSQASLLQVIGRSRRDEARPGRTTNGSSGRSFAGYRVRDGEAVSRDNRLVRGAEQSFLPASRWMWMKEERTVTTYRSGQWAIQL